MNNDIMCSANAYILITKSEDDLQHSIHNLNNTASEYSMEIYAQES